MESKTYTITPELEAKIPQYQAKYTDPIFDGRMYEIFNHEKSEECVNYSYRQNGHEIPVTLTAQNPLEQHFIYNWMKKYYTEGFNYSKDVQAVKDGLILWSDLQNKVETDLSEYIAKQKAKGEKPEEFLYEKQSTYVFNMNVYSAALYAWFKFCKDEFSIEVEPEMDKALEESFALQRESGIFSLIHAKDVAIVCRHPKEIYQDEANNWALHNTNGQALVWNYSFMPYDCYYINGRKVDGEIYQAVQNGTFTLDEFNKIDNEEDRAVVVTLLTTNKGQQGLLDFLKAELVNEEVLDHGEHERIEIGQGGEMMKSHTNYSERLQLFKTKQKYSWANDSKGNTNTKLAWLHEVCPSTGTDYLIPVCPSHNTAVDAAKACRPKLVPSSLPYKWMSAN